MTYREFEIIVNGLVDTFTKERALNNLLDKTELAPISGCFFFSSLGCCKAIEELLIINFADAAKGNEDEIVNTVYRHAYDIIDGKPIFTTQSIYNMISK